jgi:hypothetical protein
VSVFLVKWSRGHDVYTQVFRRFAPGRKGFCVSSGNTTFVSERGWDREEILRQARLYAAARRASGCSATVYEVHNGIHDLVPEES